MLIITGSFIVPRISTIHIVSQKNLSLGSLYDDWQRVEELAVGEAEPIARDLIQLAALLSYVGERLQSSC